MTIEEVNRVMDMLSNTDIEKLDIRDQAKIIDAMCEFSEKVRPILVKNMAEGMERSNFLFKL